jgi:hypothetical protein
LEYNSLQLHLADVAAQGIFPEEEEEGAEDILRTERLT